MPSNQFTYLALAALTATGVSAEATVQTKASALKDLRADLTRSPILRDEYVANPLNVLRRYGIAPEVQIEALAESHGLSVAGNCVYTGCCVTNVNT